MYSVGVAYLLWLLSGCGVLGFHRFYLGKIPTGVLWACTAGLGGIGAIYDFFTLPGQVREANIRRGIEMGAVAAAGAAAWRHVDDGQTFRPEAKDSLERVILKTARENKGIVTVSEVALAANITIDAAKKALDALVSKRIAELRVRKSGTLVYTIPEMMDRDEPLEDF